MSIKSNGKFRGDNKTILKATAGLTNPIMSDNVITVEVGLDQSKHQLRDSSISSVS